MATTKCTTWWGVSMPGRGPSIRPFLFTSLLAACAAAHAEDLLQVYRDAQRYDAVYASAGVVARGLPAAEPRRGQPGGIPGAPGGTHLRPGEPGPRLARRAGLFRR